MTTPGEPWAVEQTPASTPPSTLSEAGRRLVEVEQALDHVTGLVESFLEGAAPAGASDKPTTEDWEPYYPTVEDWVGDFFVHTFTRAIGNDRKWCPRWWDHTEAVLRLEALWRTWEAARLDPITGIATWLTQHLDHQLPVLLAPDGPFGQCNTSAHRHVPYQPLPISPRKGFPSPLLSGDPHTFRSK